jgi:hypothetical protein
MFVRLTRDLGGTHAAQPLVKGSVHDLPEATALYLIEVGDAESPESVVRTATVEPPRNAARRTEKPSPPKRTKD